MPPNHHRARRRLLGLVGSLGTFSPLYVLSPSFSTKVVGFLAAPSLTVPLPLFLNARGMSVHSAFSPEILKVPRPPGSITASPDRTTPVAVHSPSGVSAARASPDGKPARTYATSTNSTNLGTLLIAAPFSGRNRLSGERIPGLSCRGSLQGHLTAENQDDGPGQLKPWFGGISRPPQN